MPSSKTYGDFGLVSVGNSIFLDTVAGALQALLGLPSIKLARLPDWHRDCALFLHR
jgi:hypothetical protein